MFAIVSTVYGPSAGWASFPWETKRVLTVLTFKSLISSAADPALLGPVTLRKSVGPLPPNVIQELSRLAQRQNLFNSNNKIRQSPAEGPLYVKSGQIIAETSTQSSGIDSTGDLVRATSPINGPRSTAFSPLPPVDASLSPRSQQSGNGEVPGSSQQSHYNRMNTPRDHSPQPSEHSDSMDGQMMTIDPKRRARNSTGSTSDVDNRVPGPASRSRKLFNFFKGK